MVVSRGHNLLTHSVQADQVWLFVGIKVAVNGIPHSLPEFVSGIGFGKDGMTQSASHVSTFGSLFHQEKYFLCHPAVSFFCKSARCEYS